MQGYPEQLDDAALQKLASDPRFSTADFDLLNPDEQVRFKAIYGRVKAQRPPAGGAEFGGDVKEPGRWQKALDATLSYGKGALKGAGETAITFGRGANSIMEPVGDFIGNEVVARPFVHLMHGDEAMTPPVDSGRQQDLNTAYDYTKAEGTAEKAGKISEQVGEFLLPAGATRRAAISGLVHMIPDSASPGAMGVMNKVAALIGRPVGEAASAATVAGLHGEKEPEKEAMAAAAVPFMTELMAMGVKPAAWLLPYVVGSTVGAKVGGTIGVGGGLSLAAAFRNLTKLSPSSQKSLEAFVRRWGPSGLRSLIGGYEQVRENQPPNVQQELESRFK